MCSAVKSMVKFRLPKIIKFFFVLLMCLLIIISPCILKPVQVHAALTGTAIVSGAVVVAGILSALGICCYFSNADNRQAFSDGCEQIYDDCKSAIDDVVARADIAAAGLASISVPTSTMKDVFNDAVQVIPQGLMHFSTAADMAKAYQMDSWSTSFVNLTEGCIPWDNLSDVSSIQFLGRLKMPEYVRTGTDLNIPFCNVDGNTLGFNLHWTVKAPLYSDSPHIFVNGQDAVSIPYIYPYRYAGQEYLYLLKVTLVSSSLYTLCVPDTDSGEKEWDCGSHYIQSGEVAIPVPGQDVFSPSRDKFIADGTSAMNTPIDKVVNKLKEKVGDKDGNIPMTVPRGKSIDDESEKQRQSDVIGKDISDTKDRNKDIATNKANDVPATKADDNTTAAENDDTLPPAIPKAQNPKKMKIPANNLTTKFPFSIPWDLYHAISILKYPGEAPKFTLHFGSAAKVIDMSMFDPVATVARWGLSLLFLLSLIVLTGRVIKH